MEIQSLGGDTAETRQDLIQGRVSVDTRALVGPCGNNRTGCLSDGYAGWGQGAGDLGGRAMRLFARLTLPLSVHPRVILISLLMSYVWCCDVTTRESRKDR